MCSLYTHVACWLCEKYLQCGSHVCSVSYMYNDTGSSNLISNTIEIITPEHI